MSKYLYSYTTTGLVSPWKVSDSYSPIDALWWQLNLRGGDSSESLLPGFPESYQYHVPAGYEPTDFAIMFPLGEDANPEVNVYVVTLEQVSAASQPPVPTRGIITGIVVVGLVITGAWLLGRKKRR